MHKCYKCNKCNNMAVWYYMPDDKPRHKDYPNNKYYCDNCVARGCSCNMVGYPEYVEGDTYEYYKDELGRDLPCIEYDYCETGYHETDSNE